MINRRTMALLLFAAASLSAGVADASVVCERLRERLGAEPVAVGRDTELARYASALTRQNFEIRKARQQLAQLNCGTGSIVFLGSGGGNGCGVLLDAMKRMEDNRQALALKIESLRNGGAEIQRDTIRAALEANGCNAEAREPAEIAAMRPLEGPQMPRALMRQPLLNDMESRSFATLDSLAPPPRSPYAPLEQHGGGLRTLCVRSCDGAFFPISSDASPADFSRDQQRCQDMCSGAKLYYHSLLGQESADMVSAETGEPYRSMPNAFAYLNRNPGEKPACGCNLADYHRRVLAARPGAPKTDGPQSSITDIGAAAATLLPPAAADAGAAPRAQAATSEPIERAYDPAKDNVRRVGPIFLPAETSSIDLRHPAGESYQPVQ